MSLAQDVTPSSKGPRCRNEKELLGTGNPLVERKNVRSTRFEQPHVIKASGKPLFHGEPDRESTVSSGLKDLGGNRIAFLNEVVRIFATTYSAFASCQYI